MSSFRFAPAAEQDLAQILDYVEENSGSGAADRVLSGIFVAASKLAEMPAMGRPWIGRAGGELRAWVVFQYVLVYEPGRVRSRSCGSCTVLAIRTGSGRRCAGAGRKNLGDTQEEVDREDEPPRAGPEVDHPAKGNARGLKLAPDEV